MSKDDISSKSVRFTELQFELQEAGEALQTTVIENQVDEKTLLDRLDKVLNIEPEIKRLQISSIIRVKIS